MQTADTHKSRHEHQLHAIRRLDWRFLLSNPKLDRVIYFGPKESSLQTVLQDFCGEVCVCTTHVAEGDSENQHSFDLAVVKSHDYRVIKAAYSKLKGGGHVYWEVDRTNWVPPIKRSGQMKSNGKMVTRGVGVQLHIQSVRQFGFKDVTAYWHRPDFENCLDIIPLNDRKALEYFLSGDRKDFKGRLKTSAGRFLKQTKLLKFVISSVSIVGRKPENLPESKKGI
ncbi:hypothetical protein GWN42_09250 [candidate division KSB1 bacterium]|nr:hypothetical protein [candidate division KSB1 bacterium]NIR69705.1 hypothetical protein [candidate division KSB1 bacterium]NIS24901.1 hypothetical protein [candidate division KSB1 bacterium]NIU23420.1 hypothetical protein [candidate division KSB1 bacterium]NIU90722.1 hypothetical protein [candidate division KSB1 bacterium]